MIIKKTVCVVFFGALLFVPISVFAVGAYEEDDENIEWVEPVLELMEVGDHQGAISELDRANRVRLADWHSLMGYNLRKKTPPELYRSEQYYKRALEIDPNHTQALEYYGELKLMKGDLAGAQVLLKRLKALCPDGCEELELLSKAIKQFQTSH